MKSQKYLANLSYFKQRLSMQDEFKILQKIIKGKKKQNIYKPRDPVFTKVYVGWELNQNMVRKRTNTQANIFRRPSRICQIQQQKHQQNQSNQKHRILYSKSVQLPSLHKKKHSSDFKDVDKQVNRRASDFQLYKQKKQNNKQINSQLTCQINDQQKQNEKMKAKLIKLVQKVFQNKTPIQPKQNNTNSFKAKQKLGISKIKLNKLKKDACKPKFGQQWSQVDVLKMQTYFTKLSKNKIHVQRPLPQSLQCSKVKNEELKKYPNKQQIPQYIREYQPRNNKIIIDELIKDPDFQIIINQTNFYFGCMKQGKRNGQGIYVSDQHIIEGTWSKGSIAEGIQISNQGYYKGKFGKDGKRNGQGQFIWMNGERYQGQWRSGLKNGSGIWKSGKGDSYIGQWFQGQVQGYGVHISSYGQRYQGFFKQFLKDGKGKQTFPNGDVFQGEYKNGRPNGLGKYIWKNKVIYEGQFVDGTRNGKGKLEVPKYMRYLGQFLNDKPHGKGSIQYENGDSYIGQFKNGQKEGFGTLKCKNSHQVFSGLWHKNQYQSIQSQSEESSNQK